MRVLDLFSGVGGFSLGLEAAGMETVAFCEREPFCQAVLRKHWPDVPIHDDITQLDGKAYRGTVELVCGGFPCQPFSVAGKRRGAEDDRALWPEMLRVIREVQPTWVIGENVTGIIAMELDTVLSDLEGEGYSCQAFVLPACAVDAPHRRDRIWVIAHADSDSESNDPINEKQRSRELVADSTCGTRRAGVVGESSNQSHEGQETKERSADSEGLGSNGETMADSESPRMEGRKELRGVDSFGTRSVKQSERRFDDTKPAIWESEPGMGRVANGVPNRSHRLKSLGNAVVPQVVEQIGKVVMEIHDVSG